MEQGPSPLPSTTRSTFRRRTRFRSAAAALCWSVVAVVLALSAGPAILFCAAEGEATGGSGVLPSDPGAATGAPTAAPTRRPIVLVFDGEKATIKGGPSDDDESDREPYSRGWINYAFYFFRYGALLCLVCYPCVRGLGVWHSAGGRILLRYSSYDDRGRGIGLPTGLRYRPANIERWLFLTGLVDPEDGGPGSHPRGPRPPRAVPDRLSHAEVLALPEISAPAPLQGEDEHGTAHGSGDCDRDCHQTAEVVRIGAGKEEGSPTEEHAEPGGGPCTRADAGEAAASTATTTTTTTTKSTACSICLDDFEAGEPLRLLPRCGHAFHTDCILPWLTERQGVCPYCKVPVKEPPRGSDEEQDEDEDEGVDVDVDADVDEEAGGGRRGP